MGFYKETGAVLQSGVIIDLSCGEEEWSESRPVTGDEADMHITQIGGCFISFVIWTIFIFCLCSDMIR